MTFLIIIFILNNFYSCRNWHFCFYLPLYLVTEPDGILLVNVSRLRTGGFWEIIDIFWGKASIGEVALAEVTVDDEALFKDLKSLHEFLVNCVEVPSVKLIKLF